MKGRKDMKTGRQLPVDNSNIQTIVGQHARFKGELDFEGVVRIDGNFEGTIRASNGGTLIVSEVAKIIGDVNVPNLVLHGTIEGNVRAGESLKMSPSGKLKGDLEYRVLSLSEGALINGRCNRIEEKKVAAAVTESNTDQPRGNRLGQVA